MRTLALALLLTVPAAAAHADPVQEARSATAACLSAILDGAPVEDIDGDDAVIRRGKDPVSCSVRVSAGEPVVIRDAMQVAIKRRSELFSLAKTAWEPGEWASRETYCNIPGRRAVTVFVSTGKPGHQPVAIATVFEAEKRDARCDRDMGVQTIAAAEVPAEPVTAAPSVETAKAPEPEKVEVAEKPAKKKGKPSFLRRIPGLSRD